MSDPTRYDEMAAGRGMGARTATYRAHRPMKHGELLLLPLAAVGGGAYALTGSWWVTALVVVVLAAEIDRGMRPALLGRLREALDGGGSVTVGGLTVTEQGLVLPGAAAPLGRPELAETLAPGASAVVVRTRSVPIGAKGSRHLRIPVPNATVVRDFVEETRSLAG